MASTTGVPGTSSLSVGLIWAQTPAGVIGSEGSMPWHVPEDLDHFKTTTDGCPVVMGRRTWESLPQAFRPLPGRTNIVVTSNSAAAQEITDAGAQTSSSLQEALTAAAETAAQAHTIWIMGGGAIYAEAVEQKLAQIASITTIDTSADGDTFAPRLPRNEWSLHPGGTSTGWQTSSTGLRYRIDTYRRHADPESANGIA